MSEKKKALKKLIEELNEGKDPDAAKKDFKEIISDAGPDELAKVEEELVKEGMPREKLNKLCDVHLAVFQEQLDKQPILVPVGHPISILMEEHRILLEYIGKLNETTTKAVKKGDFDKISDELKIMNEVADHFKKAVKHYLREENVLFPYIEKHGLSEPPAQMWIDHDKIRALEKELFDLLEAAEKKSMKFSVFKEKILKVVPSLANMMATHYYKENNILFPAAIRLLSQSEWKTVRQDFDEIGYCCFTPKEATEVFAIEEDDELPKEVKQEGMVEFDTGPIPINFIEPILNSLPIDITFVDHEDKVRYFSKGDERLFIRTKAIIGRSVINCHPSKSYEIVERILNDFREGKRKSAEFWIDLEGNKIYIRYFAVHNKEGKYLGCIEVSQDITEIQKIEGQKRLLD
ncbi:MAG: DUF438 domain-containing protein [Candidatus Heimdallarchaeota archaeon]